MFLLLCDFLVAHLGQKHFTFIPLVHPQHPLLKGVQVYFARKVLWNSLVHEAYVGGREG